MTEKEMEELRKDYQNRGLRDVMLKKEEILHEALKFRDDDGNFIEFSANEKNLRIVAGNEAIGRHNCYVFDLNQPQQVILSGLITESL